MVARTRGGSTAWLSRNRAVAVRLALGVLLTFGPVGATILAHPTPVAAAACGIPTCTLTIALSGNGTGSWKSTNSSFVPNGFIDCRIVDGVKTSGSVCSHTYGGEDRATPLLIYFTVTAATGSEVCGVAPECVSGASFSDIFTLTSDLTRFVTISLASFNVSVSRSGTAAADGAIYSQPSGIECPPACSKPFAYGTQVTLTATAGAGSYFDHWTGACAGQGRVCAITVTGPASTSATFTLGSPPTPSPPPPTPVATTRPTSAPTAAATAKASTKPVSTGLPIGTATSPSAPPESAVTSPGTTDDSNPASPLSTAGPPTSSGPSAGAIESPSVSPSGAGGEGSIALAILGAGLLIALAIGLVGVAALRRRPSQGPPPA
jgi:hypothetical protein